MLHTFLTHIRRPVPQGALRMGRLPEVSPLVCDTIVYYSPTGFVIGRSFAEELYENGRPVSYETYGERPSTLFAIAWMVWQDQFNFGNVDREAMVRASASEEAAVAFLGSCEDPRGRSEAGLRASPGVVHQALIACIESHKELSNLRHKVLKGAS